MGFKKIYTIEGSVQLGVGGLYANQQQIGNANREYKIVSINWDLRARMELNPWYDIPINNNTIIEKRFDIASILPAVPIAEPFTNPTPLATILSNGNFLTLYNIGKRNFENFFFSNVLNCIISILNRDMINGIRIYNSIIIEIEEL